MVKEQVKNQVPKCIRETPEGNWEIRFGKKNKSCRFKVLQNLPEVQLKTYSSKYMEIIM